MGYFDKLADNAFKSGENGELVFYPNGAIGKGRVVPDEATRTVLHRFQKRMLQLIAFVGMPYGWVVGSNGILSFTALSPILLLMLYLWYKQHVLTRDLPVSEVKLSVKDATTDGARALPNWYYWLVGVVSVLVVVVAIYLPLSSPKPISDTIYYLAAGFLLFGVAGLVLAVRLYRLKNSS